MATSKASPTTSSAVSGLLAGDCPGRTLLSHVASRWAVLVLTALRDGPLRFHLLRDGVGGISEKMLSQTLRVLCRDGLVLREVEPTTPPKVSYGLTPLGKELVRKLQGLLDWITLRTDEIVAAWERHDRTP
ncbi:winged helix-turn-helix transcriptional regulator [Actinopolymorpha alba]|uniref:winged helix-turn-helix transcriptional regulator n=1 Tax=Actinopolymorpha alba TaxID=533267 RepID=UPI0009FE7450|nr:helix-turn-helix domain-containing protein [Actinopolymorpha alba]